MDTDLVIALDNANAFLNQSAALSTGSASQSQSGLALLGIGYAILAIALAQDRQAERVAQTTTDWIREPDSAKFDVMLEAIRKWTEITE